MPEPPDERGASHATYSLARAQDCQDTLRLCDMLLRAACSGACACCTGVLEHLPALHVFTASSPLSYGRIAPGTWSGAFK